MLETLCNGKGITSVPTTLWWESSVCRLRSYLIKVWALVAHLFQRCWAVVGPLILEPPFPR